MHDLKKFVEKHKELRLKQDQYNSSPKINITDYYAKLLSKFAFSQNDQNKMFKLRNERNISKFWGFAVNNPARFLLKKSQSVDDNSALKFKSNFIIWTFRDE
jgi:hypothetical protein